MKQSPCIITTQVPPAQMRLLGVVALALVAGSLSCSVPACQASKATATAPGLVSESSDDVGTVGLPSPTQPWHMAKRAFPLHLFFTEPSTESTPAQVAGETGRGPSEPSDDFDDYYADDEGDVLVNAVDHDRDQQDVASDQHHTSHHTAFSRDLRDEQPSHENGTPSPLPPSSSISSLTSEPEEKNLAHLQSPLLGSAETERMIELPREEWAIDKLPGMRRCTIDRVPDLTHDVFLEKYRDKAPVIYGRPFRVPQNGSSTVPDGNSSERTLTATERSCRAFGTKERLMQHGAIPIHLYSMSGYAQTFSKPWVLDGFLKSLDTHAIDYNDSADHVFQLFNHELGQWTELSDACMEEQQIAAVKGEEVMMSDAGVGVPGLGLPWHWHTEVYGNKIIYGRKRWFISKIPNGTPGASAGTNPTLMPWKWLRDVYPLLSQQELDNLAECTVEAGEVIYVPHGFYHQTLNLEPGFFVLYGPKNKNPADEDKSTRAYYSDLCSRRDGSASTLLPYCQKAHELFPNENEFLQVLANLYTLELESAPEMGAPKTKAAIEYTIKAVRANPFDANTLTATASLLFSLSQCYDVIALYSLHISHANPNDLHSQFLAARCLFIHEKVHPDVSAHGFSFQHDKEKYSELQNLYAIPDDDLRSYDDFLQDRAQHILFSSEKYLPSVRQLPPVAQALKVDEYYPTKAFLTLRDEVKRIPPNSCMAKLKRPRSKDPDLCMHPESDKYRQKDQHAGSHDLLVSLIAKGRQLASRHTLDISVSQKFFAFLEVFRAHAILGTFNFLTGKELTYLLSPMPAQTKATYKGSNEFALRFHAFLGLLKLSELDVMRWIVSYSAEVETNTEKRTVFQLEGLTRNAKAAGSTTVPASAAEVGQIGLAEASRIYADIEQVFGDAPPLECFDIRLRDLDESDAGDADADADDDPLSMPDTPENLERWERECRMCVVSGCTYCKSIRRCMPTSHFSLCPHSKAEVNYTKPESKCLVRPRKRVKQQPQPTATP